jgi:hypothetical protein
MCAATHRGHRGQDGAGKVWLQIYANISLYQVRTSIFIVIAGIFLQMVPNRNVYLETACCLGVD